MLQNNPYYWASIRKLVIAFGSIFSDIHVVRFNAAGNAIKTILVPCEFGPKEKWYTRNIQDPMPGVNDQLEMILPRIAYEMKGFVYDNSRKLTSTGRTVKALVSDKTTLQTQFNPVPYNFSFETNIMTKTMEDGLQIIEQIIPFFTPDYTITILDIPELSLNKDIPIVLNGVSHEDTWDGSFQDRRTVTWTLDFTVKGYLYPPVQLTAVNLKSFIFFDIEGGAGSSNSLPVLIAVPGPLDTADIPADATVTEVIIATTCQSQTGTANITT